jgi:hypothetical protein
MAVQLIGIGVTLTSADVSLKPSTPQMPWSGESLLTNVSLIGTTILLSNATVTSASSVGTVVGDFSVVGGSTRVYTFTLTAGASLFSVGGSTLSVNAALSPGSVSITAQASDTGTSVVSAPFLITIISTASGSFVPTFELFGF